eukprot:4625735-Pyramimonas_sp.AAC.1
MRRARPCGSAAYRAAPTPAQSSMKKSSQCTYLSAASPPHPAMPRVSSACSGMARGVISPTTLGVAGLELLLWLSRAA